MPSHMTTKARPRPAKGTARKMQQARRRLANTKEKAAKAAAKARDAGRCRMPGCDATRGLHAMHIRHKGLGGDPTGLRSWQRSDYVTGCARHHGLQHAGYMRMLVGPNGGDGRVEFQMRISLHRPWFSWGWSEPL